MYVIYVDGVEVFRSRDWYEQSERIYLLRSIACKRTIDRITKAYIVNEMIDGKLITY